MVGINTVLADNPSLDSRIENGKNPYKIVVDPNLKIPVDSKLLHFSDGKSIIITTKNNEKIIK